MCLMTITLFYSIHRCKITKHFAIKARKKCKTSHSYKGQAKNRLEEKRGKKSLVLYLWPLLIGGTEKFFFV